MSYTLKYTGAEIDDILDRAVEGGTIDEDLALKAPLASPALTGEPTAPTQEEGDDSEKIATTAYADRAAAVAAYAAYPTDTALGAIASFPDGADGVPVKSLKVEVTPIQDLHGYEYPWPAGGNKNKFDASLMVSPTTTAKWIQITLKQNTTYTASSSISYNSSSAYVFFIAGTDTSGATSANAGFGTGTPRTVTTGADGIVSVAYRTNGADGVKDLSQFVYQIEEGSAATSYVPYSNLAPIDGWEGATVVRTGKNRWNGHYVNTAFTAETDASSGSNCAGNLAMPIEEGKQYTFSVNGVATDMRYRFLDKNKANLTNLATATTTTTAPSGAKYLMWRNNSANQYDNVNNSGMIEVGSTATAYEPYAGDTYPISWTGKVYGGTLDVTTGVLTVTHGQVDLGNLTWAYESGQTRFKSEGIAGQVKAPSSSSEVTSAICSAYRAVAQGSLVNGAFAIGTTGNLFVRDTAYTDKDLFKAAVTGQTLVYELANPITVQLDPITVSSLLGTNNLYADSGDVEVEYRADVALYIEKKLGGGVSTLSMAPSAQPAVVRPGLSLNLTEDEPELITEDDEPDLAEDAPEALEE